MAVAVASAVIASVAVASIAVLVSPMAMGELIDLHPQSTPIKDGINAH